MKKILGIVVVSLFFTVSASSLPMEGLQRINSLIKEGYELHSTNVVKSGKYQYNLISDGSNEKERLITCVYTIEKNVAVCWIP
tara:strand:- start:51 stop:299 length:249 start_codon:yes stop_codon:yes gene_type:complete